MSYIPQDHYFKKAKAGNYAARSVFKLKEIDERFGILQVGDIVLDLGAAPGSWSQYASEKIGPKGRILGIDLQPVKIMLPNADFISGDLRELNIGKMMQKYGFMTTFDVVLSDVAPKTSGVRVTDQTRSKELSELALYIAERFLRNRGKFVCKIFAGEDLELFRRDLRARFQRVEEFRPKSTRKESKEVFLVALGFRRAN